MDCGQPFPRTASCGLRPKVGVGMHPRPPDSLLRTPAERPTTPVVRCFYRRPRLQPSVENDPLVISPVFFGHQAAIPVDESLASLPE